MGGVRLPGRPALPALTRRAPLPDNRCAVSAALPALDPFCTSSYLALRWVAMPGRSWIPGVAPEWPRVADGGGVVVGGEPGGVLDALRELTAAAVAGRRAALLLSAGIDSAILAALLGPGTRAYTLRFDAEGAEDESSGAAEFARRLGLDHRILTVGFDDYRAHAPALMRHKRAPLHAVEVALHVAAQQARADGFDTLVVGNGADSTFGGLDKLLSRDWTFPEFVRRYTFLDPARALREPADVGAVFEPYRRGADGVDVQGFLKVVHGLGIVQAFENAIGAAGLETVAPYEGLRLAGPLDIARIRGGESKYVLRAVFQTLFPGLGIPPKIAFARPMDRWLAGWAGPSRPELWPLDRIEASGAPLTGEQRWLLWCLERLLDGLGA